MPHFMLRWGRRGLIQDRPQRFGRVVMPAGSRAETAIPQPIATNLVALHAAVERPRLPGARAH